MSGLRFGSICTIQLMHKQSSFLLNHSYVRFSFQSTICICLVTIASALAQGPGGYAVEKLPPKPFQYQYGVSDDYSKANFQKTEAQDSNVKPKLV